MRIKFTILLISALLAATGCSQGSSDDNTGLLALLGLQPPTDTTTIDPTTTVSAGTVTLAANEPVAQNLTLVADTPFTYTSTISDAPAASVRTRVVTDTTAQVELKLYNDAGDLVATVQSEPGATEVTLTFTPSTGGSFTLILTANSPLLVSSTVTGVTATPDAPADPATLNTSPTANILVTCSSFGYDATSTNPASHVFCFVGEVNNGVYTSISDATVTATVGTSALTVNYTLAANLGSPFNQMGIDMYITAANTVAHTVGEQVTVNVTHAARGINFSKTVTIPDMVTNVTIQQGTNAAVNLDGATPFTLDTTQDAVIAWQLPAANAPSMVSAAFGNFTPTGTTFINASAQDLSVTISASALAARMTAAQDCQGIGIFNVGVGNLSVAMDYYQGSMTSADGTTTSVSLSGLSVGTPFTGSAAPMASEGWIDYSVDPAGVCNANTGTNVLTVQ